MLSVLFVARRAWSWLLSTAHGTPVGVLFAVVALVTFLGARACSRPPPPARETTTTEANADRQTFARLLAELEERRHEEAQTTTTRTDTRPDGRRVVTVVERRQVAQTETAAHASADVRQVEHETVREVREVVRERPSWRVGAAAGWSITRPTLRPELYGVDLSRRIAGPVWLGVWARTDRTAGVSVAVEW